MGDDEPVAGTRPVAEEPIDPQPFLDRCDEVEKEWGDLQERSQGSGNKADHADKWTRFAGFVLAGATAAITTLVAADVKGDLLTPTTSAILAAAATVATGIQASGFFRNQAKHHYERVDHYRTAGVKAGNVKSGVESKAITVKDGVDALNELADLTGTRPPMP
jgi:hypothetical protein